MANLDVPVALLQTSAASKYGRNSPCCELVFITIQNNRTIEEFRSQLASLLRDKGRNLVQLTFKGAKLLGDATVGRCLLVASARSPPLQAPRFAATYELNAAGVDPFLQIRVLTIVDKDTTITCRCALTPYLHTKFCLNCSLTFRVLPLLPPERLMKDQVHGAGKLLSWLCTNGLPVVDCAFTACHHA